MERSNEVFYVNGPLHSVKNHRQKVSENEGLYCHIDPGNQKQTTQKDKASLGITGIRFVFFTTW